MFGEAEGAAVYGDKGYVVLGNNSWRAYGSRNKLLRNERGSYDNTVACHLGNAAWRAGRTLRFDAKDYRFIDDEDAAQYVPRPEYRKPWLLPAPEDM